MARKRHTAHEIVAKLPQVDVLIAQGRPVADAVRSIGVTEVTYYRWRNEYGGLKGDQVKRLKELETLLGTADPCTIRTSSSTNEDRRCSCRKRSLVLRCFLPDRYLSWWGTAATKEQVFASR